jgi:hypothetical protein
MLVLPNSRMSTMRQIQERKLRTLHTTTGTLRMDQLQPSVDSRHKRSLPHRLSLDRDRGLGIENGADCSIARERSSRPSLIELNSRNGRCTGMRWVCCRLLL